MSSIYWFNNERFAINSRMKYNSHPDILGINHSKHFVRHGVRINGIESFWSFTKRRLAKFNVVKKYFELHLKECEWRWNKTPAILTIELCKILKNFNYLMV
jgi:transposase-like protein